MIYLNLYPIMYLLSTSCCQVPNDLFPEGVQFGFYYNYCAEEDWHDSGARSTAGVCCQVRLTIELQKKVHAEKAPTSAFTFKELLRHYAKWEPSRGLLRNCEIFANLFEALVNSGLDTRGDE